MTGPISWEQVAGLLGLIALLAGGGAAIWTRIESRIKEVDKRASDALSAVSNLELKMAREYATITHLQMSEDRLTKAIAKLEQTVEQLPSRLAELLRSHRE